jgi:uncharacterized RDD family membrane protein YckC
MNWYYVQQGQRVGPLSNAEFQALLGSGVINSETLVWRPGMANWQRYREIPPQTAEAMAGSETGLAIAHHKCVECGNVFTEEDMVRYADNWVCAACKPVFFQRLREGVPTRPAMIYGGFWIRFLAKFLDQIILMVANYIVQFVFILILGFGFGMDDAPSPASITGFVLMMIIQFAIPALYNTWFVGRYAATPGKMACGLIIVTPEGGRVSYPRALARYFAEILSGMILLIGYIMAAFDDEKRTLHDRICDTRVTRK